jgi:uncharacterized protein (DUF433 family)/DNA-binding transcriptional MerR regulator
MDTAVNTRRPAETGALGLGVYSPPELLRLVNFDRHGGGRPVSRQTLARWLKGYSWRDGDESHVSPPLWAPDYEGAQVSFRDLVELRFVKAFRDLGLSLTTIRKCFERAVEEVGDDRPFSTRRFRTDGKTIFLEITDDIGEGQLVDLKDRQAAFRRIILPSLKDFEFEDEAVARWYPLGVNEPVVVDPALSFGRPIVREGGVPTEVLSDAVKADGTAERVARLYEIPVAAVRQALAFEQKLAA